MLKTSVIYNFNRKSFNDYKNYYSLKCFIISLKISIIAPYLILIMQILRFILLILSMLFMNLDLNSFLECLLVNLNIGDDFVYSWRDYTFKCYPWAGYWADKFTGLGPGGGPPQDGPDLWISNDENFRRDPKRNRSTFNPSGVDILKDISIEGYVTDKFGPQDQRSLGGIGPKIYLKDIDSLESLGSNKFYRRLLLEGDTHWSEHGLRMNIITKGERTFDHAFVHYPGNLSVKVDNESNLVKIILKQRDIAGVHFFENGTGVGQNYSFRMKRFYNLTLKNQEEIDTVIRFNKMFQLYNKQEENWVWTIEHKKGLDLEGQNKVKKYINKEDQWSVNKDLSLSNLANKQDNNRSTNRNLRISDLLNK